MAGIGEGQVATPQWHVVVPGRRSGASHEAEITLNELDIAFNTTADSQTRQISFEDLIGIQIIDRKVAGNVACTAEIHSLPVVKRRHRKTSRRYTIDRVVFSDGQSFEQNSRRAKEWKAAAMKQCEKAVRNTFFYTDEALLDSACSDTSQRKRKLLVLINPASGPGKSEKSFRGKVQPLFELADIDLDIVVTEQAGHAKRLVKSYDLSLIDGIVVSSGDGLIYEVLNGLMSRDDRQTAIKTPLGHIPTGSGNALCVSLLYQNQEEVSLASAALQIIRGGVEPVDLASVQTMSNETLYMLLLAQWGMLADIDIESEKLRRLGGKTRDTLGALKCIAQKRTYRGRLRYLPVNVSEEEQADTTSNPGKEQHQSASPHIPEEQQHPQDGHMADDEGHSVPQSSGTSLPSNMQCVPTLLSPTPTDPLPGSWKTVEGVFIMVTILMAPLMGDGFVGHPDITLGSGEFTILYILDDVSRSELLLMLKDGDTGNWVNHPKVHHVKAKAYRIEPLSPPGMMTLDGELIEYGASQAQVHQHVARVFTRKRIINA